MRNDVLIWLGRARTFASTYDRRLWILYGGFVASSMGFAMIVPFVSLYFYEELGVPMSLVGAFFLVSAVVRSSFQGYAGELSDRLGRVRIMTAGQGARGVLFGVMALAVFTEAGFWIASGVLILSYVAGAFFQPVAGAAVSDLVEPERRLEAYALMRVAHNLGWGIGPMLGGFMAGIGYGWLFVFGAVTSLFSAWVVGRFVTETMKPAKVRAASPSTVDGARSGETAGSRAGETDDARAEPDARSARLGILEVRHDRRFLLFCGLSLLVFITMSQWLSTLSVWGSSRMGVTTTQLGLMFGLNGFMVVVFQLPVTRGLRFLSLIGAMILGSLIYSVSFLGLAFATAYVHLVFAMIAITVGELVISAPSIALVSLMAPEGRTGRYMGVYSLTSSFAWSAGPFVGGVLLDLWMGTPLLVWGTIAGFTVAAAAGFWWFRGLYPTGATARAASPAA